MRITLTNDFLGCVVLFIPIYVILIIQLSYLSKLQIQVLEETDEWGVGSPRHLTRGNRSVVTSSSSVEEEGSLTVTHGRRPVWSHEGRGNGGNTGVGAGKGKGKKWVSGYVQRMVRSYDEMLEEIIPYQTMSWNFVMGYQGADEAVVGHCPRGRVLTTRENGSGGTNASTAKAAKSLTTQRTQQQRSHDVWDEMIWDDETDVSRYFQELWSECSAHAVKQPNFFERCWGTLERLIYEPRCTSRFDSTVRCRGGVSVERPPSTSIDEYNRRKLEEGRRLLDRYMSNDDDDDEDIVNVVIVGAGPAGLFLANALTELERMDEDSWHPHFRVVILDKRLEKVSTSSSTVERVTGLKSAFTRNWQTVPLTETFVQAVDPRIGQFFELISRPDEPKFALPLNAVEALLYLSCRERGVRFVYGSDPLNDYKDIIRTKPNVIAFDATGHRLEGDVLVRGRNCGLTDQPPDTVRPWAPVRDQGWDWFGINDYHHLLHHRHVVGVASHNHILYPVDPDHPDVPFSSYWLHIHDIPHPQGTYQLDAFWDQVSNKTSLCRACENMNNPMCDNFCYPNGFFDSSQTYRNDIIKNFYQQQRKKTNSPKQSPKLPWFALRGANVNLTPAQALDLLQIMDEGGYKSDPVGMPLSVAPLQEMAKNPIYYDNRLIHALVRFAEYAEHGKPILSVFQHRPYIYRNGHHHDHEHDPLSSSSYFGPDVPFLRIGDSLSTGDPNRSSGLLTHFHTVRMMLCRMRGERDFECNREDHRGQGRRNSQRGKQTRRGERPRHP